MGLYHWVGPGSDLGDGNNWFNNIAGTTGTEPNDQDDATIFTAGTLTGDIDVNTLAIQSQGTGTLQFGGGGLETLVVAVNPPTTITGSVLFSHATLETDGFTVESDSTLTITSGSFESAFDDDNDITIGSQMGAAALIMNNSPFNGVLNNGSLTVGAGNGGSGKLTIENGSSFALTAALTVLGADAGSTGQVTVSGALTEAKIYGQIEIGGNGTGSFTVAAGAYAQLGVHADVAVGTTGGDGTLAVMGAGSLASVSGNLYFGSSSGPSGTGVVSQGATLEAAGSIEIYAGSLSVSGAGSLLSVDKYISAGAAAQLSISDGATARFIDLEPGSGTVLLQGGTLAVRNELLNVMKISGHGVVSAGVGIDNLGTLSASGGTLQVIGAETGDGHDIITKASTLELDSAVDANAKISFQTGAHTLSLKDAVAMAGVIHGFGTGETIDLLGDAATMISFTNDILTIQNGTTTEATLHFSGSYAAANFRLASDGHGGSQVSYVSPPAGPKAPVHIGAITFMSHVV